MITDQFCPGVTIPERNSKTIGDETEITIIYELATRGYEITVPFGDNRKYDLILDDDGTLYKIQCKTGWQTKKGPIRFNTHSQTTRDGEYYQTTYYGEIDAFVVWYPVDQRLFWIDVGDLPVSKMDLRDDAAIDHPVINWAKDFELGDEIPHRAVELAATTPHPDVEPVYSPSYMVAAAQPAPSGVSNWRSGSPRR